MVLAAIVTSWAKVYWILQIQSIKQGKSKTIIPELNFTNYTITRTTFQQSCKL